MKHGAKPRGHIVDLLFVLALFCVFAATALMVVLIGANVYKSTVQQMDKGYTQRTSLAYIATKVRQNDARDSVYVVEREGGNALVLRQTIDGQPYETWIYHYDGALREVFHPAGAAPGDEAGQAVVEASAFQVEAQNGMLAVAIEDADGTRYTRQITVRCGLGAAE